ncbi:hypothetical protein AAY473_037265 [Plecturocebus cupreus]
MVPAYISNEDLETLTLQVLQHDLMASYFTQSTTQSTVAEQSSQEATAGRGCGGLAKQELGLPEGCQEMHFNTNERPQQALCHNHVASSMGISISSGGDLETLPQQALLRNYVASSIKSSRSRCGDLEILPHCGGDLETLPQQALPHNRVASTIKSSTRSAGDLETLAQQALQCNCVVAAYIGNKDLETLILQALLHDLMASSFTPSTTQSTVAQQSSQKPLSSKLGSPRLCWPGLLEAWAAARLPGDAFQY